MLPILSGPEAKSMDDRDLLYMNYFSKISKILKTSTEHSFRHRQSRGALEEIQKLAKNLNKHLEKMLGNVKKYVKMENGKILFENIPEKEKIKEILMERYREDPTSRNILKYSILNQFSRFKPTFKREIKLNVKIFNLYIIF